MFRPVTIMLSKMLPMAVALSGCGTTYTFVSEPPGAAVYHQANGGAALLGTTPLEFAKSGLPEDKPFLVTFEHKGFEKLQVLVTPTDGAHTRVDAALKPAAGGGKDDPGLVRARGILAQVFKVQELTARKRYAEAIAELRDLEAREPTLAEAHVLKGSLHVVMGDTKAAREAWTRALELDPALDQVRDRLAKLGDRDKAAAGGTSP